MVMHTHLKELLEPDNQASRQRFKHLLRSSTAFKPQRNTTLDQQRELALLRLRLIAENRLISVKDFVENPLNIFAVHEIAGMIDGSMATKMTVQFNLFGGTVLRLGTEEKHHKLLPLIDSLSVIGCFALTELGYGNNAVEMETTATYQPSTKRFIINSPSALSQKFWITNGGVHANYALVFAQTLVNGRNEGIHAFLTPIRDRAGKVLQGVNIRDMGWKLECNGVDNAALAFENISVPTDSLLDRYSQINPATGEFRSSIEKKRDRFLKVADQLLSGRLCISAMSLGGTKAVIAITHAYTRNRLSVGATGASDTPIGEFQLVRNSLITCTCRTLLLSVAFRCIKERYAASQGADPELIRLCCVIKPLVTWNFERTASICRERCGGQGYLSCNAIASAIGFSHAGITAEGDNAVLMQKVSKDLVLAWQQKAFTLEESSTGDIEGIFRNHLIFQLNALGEKSKSSGSNAASLYDLWMRRESLLIQSVAQSFGEWFLIKSALGFCRGPCKSILLRSIKVFGWDCICKNSSLSQFVTGDPLDRLSSAIYCMENDFPTIIQAFDVPLDVLDAPITGDWKAYFNISQKASL